jgi:hypothetical protein
MLQHFASCTWPLAAAAAAKAEVAAAPVDIGARMRRMWR